MLFLYFFLVSVNQTINLGERSALNIKNYVEFSKPDYQREMFDKNQNILVDKQIDYMELSPICKYIHFCAF